MTIHRTPLIILVFVCLLVAGMVWFVPPFPHSNPEVQAEVESVHAHSPGKPNAGLAVSAGSRHQLQVGYTQTITLALSSTIQEGLLHINVSSQNADLELLSSGHYQFNLAQEPEPTLTLELLPYQEGRFYLSLNAAIKRGELPPQGQSLAVLIQVGEPLEQQQSRKAAPAPEVISLPARERIHRDNH